jgi:hypothetical protein
VRRAGLLVKRLLAVAAAVWVGRWALLELASFAARRLPLPKVPPRNDREPGRMPGPFDR